MAEFRFTRNLNRKNKEENDSIDPENAKKEYVERWKQKYPGMKKKFKLSGPDKKPPVKYSDLKPFEGKPKANLSQNQLKTFNERIKVREGETIEQWKKRTRSLRVIEEDEIPELPKNHELRIKYRKRAKSNVECRNKVLTIMPAIRDFDFMKYYGIVINFYTIKYGIRKDDLEVGFYFYDGVPFTRERFENTCILNSGSMTGKFVRFKKNKYIEEVIKTEKRYNLTDKKTNTGLYKLNKSFSNKLTYIYKVLGKMNGIRLYNQKAIAPLNDELRQIFYEMNLEIMEIQTGKKPQEK